MQKIILIIAVVLIIGALVIVTSDDITIPLIEPTPDRAIIRSISQVYIDSQVYSLSGVNIWHEPMSNWEQCWDNQEVPTNEDIYIMQNMIWRNPTHMWAELKIEHPNGTISWGSTDWEYSYVGTTVTNFGPGFMFQCPENGYYDLTIYMGDITNHPRIQ